MQRRLTAILAADVVGFSRLAAADEEGTVSRLRALRHELIDPVIATHHGRIVKTTGDGVLTEFGSVVDATRAALEVQRGMALRNQNVAPEKRIEFRIGIHLGDVIVESDGDLMGDGVNIAARLESIAAPGGVCLSGAAYEQVRDKVAADFVDLGERDLKNIPRPVRIYAIAPTEAPLPTSPRLRGEEKQRDALRDEGPTAEQGPPRLSIVVLPFANIGGDPEQEYFVDGVTESLTTDLSRMNGSFVIGRNTAFTYKDKAVDLKHVGRELNVRYVLEGSVQKGGNRLRVNVQLIEAETGAHLWAERFDKPVADLFDMQDEIVARLANQLNTELTAAESRRAERNPAPDSMDLYFQGLAWVNKGLSRETLNRAREFFERALQLDPEHVDALARRALVDFGLGSLHFTDDLSERVAMADEGARKALSLAPDHALAHLVLGYVCMVSRRGEQAIRECEYVLTLDRNFAHAHAQIGFAKIALGRAAETEAHVLDALRLSPRDVRVFHWCCIAGMAKSRIRRDDEAVPWLRRSIDANPNFPPAYFSLAGALAQLGRLDEAQSMARIGLSQQPNFTIAWERANYRGLRENPIVREQDDHVLDGLRKAGLPEE